MALTQNDYTQGGYYETDEQRRLDEEERRRRRLEQEAAAAGKSTSIFDIPGQLLDKRLADVQTRMDNVSQFATDPEAAIRQRLFDEKPTPVKQTITTDPETGAQTMKIEGSVEDLSSANSLTPTVSGPVVPMGQGGAGKPGETAVGGTEPTPDQTEQQRRADGLRAMMSGAGTQVAGPVPTPAAAAPVAAPVAPTQTFAEDVAARKAAQPSLGAQPVAPTSVVPVNAVTQITPTGAPVVAAPAPATSLAQAGAQATVDTTQSATPAVVAEPAWLTAANAAGNDFNKLVDVVAKHPEARVAIQEKMMTSVENTRKENEARKLVESAQSGDPKAMNKLEQALRPDKGKQKDEITVSDYLKAYMYQRLGLNELAADVQKKIMGKESKFGQINLGNSVWKTETDATTGELVRAWDNENTPATKSTLAKLSAAGQKVGVQAFGFTSGISTVPSTGEPLQARQNSVSGNAEYVYMTGPNKGQVYAGSEIPVQQRVSTQAMVDYNKKLIDFNTSPNIAGATELMKIAVGNDRGDGEEIKKAKSDITNKLGIVGLTQALGSVPGAAPAASTDTKKSSTDTTKPATDTTKSVADTKLSGGTSLSYSPSAKKQGESENMYQSRVKREEAAFNAEIQKRKELEVAEGKPPAEARGKIEAKDINNQNFANSTYDLVKPIADLIKKSTGSGIGAGVDKLASQLAIGTQGAAAIAELEVLTYPLISNVPRFEGPQGVRDVELYERAAGDLANANKPVRVRLAALNAMLTMLKKYDKAGTNDWTFGSGKPASEIKIISREKV